MVSVGVRELRNNLSRYLRRVRDGESLLITDHGEPIGELAPAAVKRSAARARALVRNGLASWSGGKPRGLASRPRPRAGLVSDAVIEDRR
jgi:prevent-host-death family protein